VPDRHAILPRRAALAWAAAGVGATASCSLLRTGSAEPTERPKAAATSPSPSEGPDPLVALLRGEEILLAAYDATLARHGGLREMLAPLRADHAQHVSALRELLVDAAPATPSASAGATGTAGAAGAAGVAGGVAGDPAAAVAALRDAERAQAAAAGTQCVRAPAGRAPLLGSVAACESSHVALLLR